MKRATKNLMYAIAAGVIWLGFAMPSYAVTSQDLEIHVSINVTKSLSVNTTFYDFGALTVNTASNSATEISVTNDSGGITETYTMLAGNAISDTGGTDWTLASSTSTDQYALAAQFSTSRPDNDIANWGSDDLTSGAQACSATQFGNGTAGESGSSVSPSGGSNVRNLWFRIRTPDVVADPSGHTATVTLAVQ